jgi:TRAP-type C4-dicarboxylate transport system substrate-binding protein
MAAGGMVVTPQRPEDVAMAEKLIAPYWDEWAKSKGPEAVEALKKVRAALGR